MAMVISEEHQLVFVHVPKTGGTTVSRVLARALQHQPGLSVHQAEQQHLTVDEIVKTHPHVRHYYKFGFIRNTWERVLSMYMFNHRHLRARGSMDCIEWGEPFRAFLNRPLTSGECRSQLDWTSGLDYVGEQKNLKAHFDKVCEHVGLPWLPFPEWVNCTAHRHYTHYYQQADVERVRQLYAPEIEHFGFSFGD
jgi:hypothetical protein